MVGIFYILVPLVLAVDPTIVKYAVNCGGNQYKSSEGIIYQKDSGFSSGSTNDAGSDLKI